MDVIHKDKVTRCQGETRQLIDIRNTIFNEKALHALVQGKGV